MNQRRMFGCLLLLGALCRSAPAQDEPTPRDVVARVTAAAERLLATLDADQRERLLYAFDDQRQRRRWSNLPTSMAERGGLRMGDLTDAQKEAVLAMIRATLSERGFQQVIDNMHGDEVLRQASDRGRSMFGKDEFYVSILGTPSTEEPWMWQFGGHHLGLNATMVGSHITLAPSLTGGQPVDYELDGRKVRQLAAEEDAAFRFVQSLTEAQRGKAVLGEQRVDWKFGPRAERIEPQAEGIRASELSEPLRELLLDLIRQRVGILKEVHAEQAMERIAKDLPETYFAWYGPTEPGAAATFRIQGPSAIIEYAPQHMGGSAVQHTHAIYRDPGNEYGAGFIAGSVPE